MYHIPKELQDALEDFERRKLWGQIQLDYQRGVLVTWRKTETSKTYANEEDNRNDPQRFNR